jgi:hypothetical protein
MLRRRSNNEILYHQTRLRVDQDRDLIFVRAASAGGGPRAAPIREVMSAGQEKDLCDPPLFNGY